MSVTNKATITAAYKCWHSFLPVFFLSSCPALSLETIIADVDKGMVTQMRWAWCSHALTLRDIFFKEHAVSYGLPVFLASCISVKVMKISRIAAQVTAAWGIMLKACCRQEHTGAVTGLQ